MKSSEFYQLVNTTIYLSDKIDNLKEIIPFIDKIRKEHHKLQVKLEYSIIDPVTYESQTEKDHINAIAKEIKIIANEIGINVVFNKLPEKHLDYSIQFRETKDFVNYFYNKILITGLIVFSENKKKPTIKKNEDIKEIKDFDFEIPGNDLPALDNIKI